jgi:flagellin
MSVINTNVKALDAQASLMKVDRSSKASMERLSTGLRINSAKDDAAGLAISNRMTAQIRGYAVAIRNSNDGISMAQTAEGGLGQVSDMLQRMRELAVQAGNGSMSAADRQSLQLEVDQMKQQINNVAATTNHNNIKLLDGSAGKITLQTGVTSGDTMNIGFESVQTKDIGFGTKPSLSSINASVDTVGALTTGDLLLNGVVVGPSLATDDSLSKDYSGTNAASAIAKAAAINRVTAQSGVTATVGQTTVYGSGMSAMASGTTSSGTVTINGFKTSTVTLGTDTEINRTMLATAINNMTSQTGVVAVNTHDDKQGIVLTAADGRNVTLARTSTDAAFLSGTGLAATGATDITKTYVGTYELTTSDSRPITVSTSTTGNVQNSGLRPGTFVANKAQATSILRDTAVAGVAPSDDLSTTGQLNGNTLVINGVGIDAANGNDDTSSNIYATSSSKVASAIAIAAAINKKTDATGVSAKADANIIRGSTFTAGEVTDLNINGVTINIGLTALKSNRDDVITAINSYQGQTGVVASAWGAGVQLTAADGRNISIGSSNGDASNLGLATGSVGQGTGQGDLKTYYASVSLSSDKQFTIASGNEGNTNLSQLGFRRGTFGGPNGGTKVADVDVSTQAGSSVAIQAIDAALEQVSSMQAKAGAFQNRLESVVNNLTESNQNMSASRSRILDTDYATETTNLARSQIITQAATAMLAQANQASQTVLALLK